MWGMLCDVAGWAIDRVLGAEKTMPGKSGAEKRAAVVSMLESMIPLPEKLEWLDDWAIGWLVDAVCEKLNWLTDYDFSKTELDEKQKEKVVSLLGVSVASVADTAGKSVDERLDNLFQQYGIEKAAETEIKPTVATPETDAELERQYSADEKWERSIAFSLKWEGGRNFDVVNGKPVVKGAAKADTGGATAYGITIPTLKAAYMSGVVPHMDICKLTQAEAKLIYRKNFWERYGWGELEWPVCMMCLDISINHGGFAWILQRAEKDCGQDVVIDGKFGPKTFAAAKACNPVALAKAIVKQRKAYYEGIVAKNASQKVFLNGWLRRNNEMAKEAGV